MAKEKFDYSESSYNKRTNLSLLCFNGKSKGDERVLSNYYPFNFNVGGVEFHSVEQYYHYRRFEGHPTEQAKILTYKGAKNAHESRHYAHIRPNQGKLIMDETKRIEIMREGLKLKLDHCKEFKEYLFSTGIKEYCKAFKDYVYNDYKELVEYAPWGDSFWGVVSVGRGTQEYRGRNILGKLLMELRGEYCLTESGEIRPILTPVEPPTVEVAPTIQPTEKKPSEEPKQDEPTFPDIKTLYTAKDYSDLSSITGVFQVTKRDDTCTKTEYPTNYKKALEIYNRFCDDLEKSSNPSFANVTLNNNIIHCRLYETMVDVGELPF